MNLETRVRRLERLCVGLGIALAASLAIGAVQRAPKEIRAEKLTITDADGNARVILYAKPKTAGMMIVGPKLEDRITISTDVNGTSSMAMWPGGAENPGLELFALPSGTSEVTLSDRGGRSVKMTASPNFKPTVEFMSGEKVTHSVP